MKKQLRFLERLTTAALTIGLLGTALQAEGSPPFTVQDQPEGSLDSSFRPSFSAEFATALTIVATQFDGAMWIDRSTPHPVPLLARLSADGAQVDYFGGLGGYRAIGPDGGILFSTWDGIVRGFPNGGLDPSFPAIGDANAENVRFLSDGKIVVFSAFGSRRLLPNGQLDVWIQANRWMVHSFGSFSPNPQSYLTAILDRDGRLLVVGETPPDQAGERQYGLFRFKVDGSLLTLA